MYDMIRFWTMSISDFLDEYFETDVIKAYLAVSAIIGTALGPMSPGTAYVLLHHYMGDVDGNVGAWGFARGGMGVDHQGAGRVASRRRAARSAPAAGVEQILVKNGRATGVVLDGGDEILRQAVVSNMDVKRTFLKHVDEKELPDDFVKRVQQLQDPRLVRQAQHRARRRAEIHRRCPRARPCIKGDLHFTDSIERMERAYDDWKAGRWSAAIRSST